MAAKGAGGEAPTPFSHEQLMALDGLPLLPCGAGDSGKAPLDPKTGRHLAEWQNASYAPQQIAAMNGKVRCVGSRCGPDAGGLLSLDLDGLTACQTIQHYGVDPATTQTWVIGRTTDPHRLKLQYHVPERLWRLLVKGKAKCSTGPDEQVEAYWSSGQVVVLGEHISSCGHYFWRNTPADAETLDDRHPLWPLVVELLGEHRKQPPAPARPTPHTPPHAGIPPRPPGALEAALQQVPEFHHDQGERELLLGLCLRLWTEVGRERALELMQRHSPGVRDIASYFTSEPKQISPGSIWPFLHQHCGFELKRHDLRRQPRTPPPGGAYIPPDAPLDQPAGEAPAAAAEQRPRTLTAAEKLDRLRQLAADMLASKTPYAERLPILRAEAEVIGLTIRDQELLAILTAARRATTGSDQPVTPGHCLDVTPTPWLWEGLVMRGRLNLFIALPKQGKTSLALSWIAAHHRDETGLPGPHPPRSLSAGARGRHRSGRQRLGRNAGPGRPGGAAGQQGSHRCPPGGAASCRRTAAP